MSTHLPSDVRDVAGLQFGKTEAEGRAWCPALATGRLRPLATTLAALTLIASTWATPGHADNFDPHGTFLRHEINTEVVTRAAGWTVEDAGGNTTFQSQSTNAVEAFAVPTLTATYDGPGADEDVSQITGISFGLELPATTPEFVRRSGGTTGNLVFAPGGEMQIILEQGCTWSVTDVDSSGLASASVEGLMDAGLWGNDNHTEEARPTPTTINFSQQFTATSSQMAVIDAGGGNLQAKTTTEFTLTSEIFEITATVDSYYELPDNFPADFVRIDGALPDIIDPVSPNESLEITADVSYVYSASDSATIRIIVTGEYDDGTSKFLATSGFKDIDASLGCPTFEFNDPIIVTVPFNEVVNGAIRNLQSVRLTARLDGDGEDQIDSVDYPVQIPVPTITKDEISPPEGRRLLRGVSYTVHSSFNVLQEGWANAQLVTVLLNGSEVVGSFGSSVPWQSGVQKVESQSGPGIYVPLDATSLQLVARLVVNDNQNTILAESAPVPINIIDGALIQAGAFSNVEIKRKGEDWMRLPFFTQTLIGNDTEIRVIEGFAAIGIPGNKGIAINAKDGETTTAAVRDMIWNRENGLFVEVLMGADALMEVQSIADQPPPNQSPTPPGGSPPADPEPSTEEIARFTVGLPINNSNPDADPVRVVLDSTSPNLHFRANNESTPFGRRTLAWFAKGSGEVSSTTSQFGPFTLAEGHQAEITTTGQPTVVSPASRQTGVDNGQLSTQSVTSSPISGLLAGNAGTLIALGRDSGELQNIDAGGNASLWRDIGPGILRWGGLAAGANAGEVHVSHFQAYAGDTIQRVTSGSAVDLTDQVLAPAGIARAPDGNLFCASPTTGKVFRITPAGAVSEAATDLAGPTSVACDPINGDVYVGTTIDRKIFHIPGGSGPPVEIFQFASPVLALAADPVGGRVFAAVAPQFASSGASPGNAGLPQATIYRVTASGSSEQIGTGFANPTALAADDSGNLYIADSSLDEILKISIDQIRDISVTGNLNFGDVAVGSSAFRAMTIRNFGNADLTVTSIDMPADFSANWNGGVIPPGGQQGVFITFAPTSANVYNGTMAVQSDATTGDDSQAFSARAIGEPGPGINLSGDLDFGTVLVGFLPTRQLTITNTGDETLNVSGLTYPAGFRGDWSGSIAPGALHRVTVLFEPTAAQAYGGPITVDSDAAFGDNTIACSGSGTAPGADSYMVLLDSNEVAGSLQVDVKAGGQLRGVLLLNGEKIRFRGTANGTNASITVQSKNFGEIDIEITLPLDGEEGGITGTVSGEGFDATLSDGGREVYDRDNPFEDADLYTFALQENSDDCAGYGSLSVSKAGAVRLKIVMGGGYRASWKGTVLDGGVLPIYLVVPRRKHPDGNLQISGQLTFEDFATTDLSGLLDLRDDSGDTGSSAFFGCSYQKPAKGVRVLAGLQDVSANALVRFGTSSGGTEVADREVTIDDRNRVRYDGLDRPDKFAMKISAKTGLWSGKFAIPGDEGPEKGKFGGVVLQKSDDGLGCYQAASGSGLVGLNPLAAVPFRILSAGMATGTVANGFSYQIDAAGAVTYGVEGTLPAGLTLNQGTGEISGTPSIPGIYYVTVWAENAAGERVAQILKILARTLFEGTQGLYTGLVRENPMQHRSCGTLSLKLATSGAFSAKLQQGASRFNFRGVFDSPGGAWNGTLTDRKSGLNYDVTLQMLTPGVGTQIDGTYSEASSGFAAAITLDLLEYHRKRNPCALAGTYTAALPGANAIARPGSDPMPVGDGAAVLSVNTGGIARLKGTAGDGAPWSAASVLVRESAGPVIPIYSSIYKGVPGAFCGEATFRDMPGVSDFDAATIYWRKPPNTKDKFYPAGFEGEVPLVGSRFDRPGRNQRALDLADSTDNARFEAGGGDIVVDPMQRALTWLANNRITYDGADRFRAAVNTRNGSFRGNFPYLDGAKNRKAKFSGVLLQKQNAAFGNFRGSSEAGWVTLGPPGQAVSVFFEDFELSLPSRGWSGAAAANGFAPPPDFFLSAGNGNPGQSLRFVADAAAGSDAEGDTYSISLASQTIPGPLATADLSKIRLTADLRDADLSNTHRFRIESATDAGFGTITGRRQFDVSANGSFQEVGGALSDATAIGPFNPLDPFLRIVITLNHNNWGFDDGNVADWDNVSLEVFE